MRGKGAVKVFLIAVLITYPVFVFLALMVFHLPISIVSLGMLVIAVAYFGFFGSDGKKNWNAIILGVIAVVVLVTQSELVLRFYPIAITLVFLVTFTVPLIKGKPIITRFAMMMDPAIETHPGRGILERCCLGLNIAWIVHLVISLGINVAISFGSTLEVWTIFNAVISYLVMGILIALQFVVIILANRKADRKMTYNDMTPEARPRDYVVGYYGQEYRYKSPDNRTWGDLFDAVSAPADPGKACPDDLWDFTVAVVAARLSDMKQADDTMDYTAFISGLWEEQSHEKNNFHFLPCPGKRRVRDLVRGICER
ncbi:MAG: hypothetical protein ILP16_06280 [Spirochaetales bacterium]|nr:hypothetical protein [Spirochaetales bacterium]